MVSRLFSSLSGMLTSSKASIQNVKGKDDIKNDNEPSQLTMEAKGKGLSFEEKTSSKKSDFDLQFINAESLDRAIVNRLQSKMGVSVANVLEQRNSESRVKLRCEKEMPEALVPSRFFQNDNDVESTSSPAPEEVPVVSAASGQPDPAIKMSLTGYSNSRTRSVPLVKESLSQSSIMSQHNISPGPTTATHIFKQFVEQSDATTETPSTEERQYTAEALAPEERRSIMYRNSQFNLENSSREALCSNSSKLIHAGELHSDTMLHLPMFGIPDPALHRRPSLTSSTESVRGSNSRHFARSEFTNSSKKRARSMSPSSLGRPFVAPRISGTRIADHIFESTVNDIIDKGGDEFKSKYSSWIWDAFRAQLVKLKSLMLNEFNDKMKEALDEREHEVLELQKRYRQKLAEFDGTTDNFQKLMDNMYKENQRVLTAKDFIIDKLKKEFLECKRHFEQDLQRQMQGYRKEAEVERIELQKRNDELMLIMLTDASKCGLEEAFKNEIESLHKMIKALTTQNEELHQQLDDATSSASILSRTAVENLETQLDHATVEMMELRKKLQYTESEKEDLRVSYHQEIAKLNRKIQESSTKYDHQLRDAAEELEALRKKHARDTKELKQKLATQEAQHNSIVSQVRQQYGSQVESLSIAVSQLRAELTGSGASTRFSH